MHPKYTLIPLAFSVILAAAPTLSAGSTGRQVDPSPVLAELDETERATLLFMREEERLARDVYVELGVIWQALLFDNIAQSEQTHMDSVKNAMDRYALPDPSDPTQSGVYVDPNLQALYADLVERGEVSYMYALRVGALIEEVDIADLEAAIAETDNPDLQTLYFNLLRGSRNHLRAFVAEIERQGVAYEAQELDPAAVDAIVDTPMERGGQGRRGENGQGGQGQRQGAQGGARQRLGLIDQRTALDQSILVAGKGNGSGQHKGQGSGQGQGQGRGSASAYGLPV